MITFGEEEMGVGSEWGYIFIKGKHEKKYEENT